MYREQQGQGDRIAEEGTRGKEEGVRPGSCADDHVGLDIFSRQSDLAGLEKELATLRAREDGLEEERRKLKKKVEVVDQKEKRIHNAEMSLIFKEKLNLEGKRRYERQKAACEQSMVRIQ